MKKIVIRFEEKEGLPRIDEPVNLGIPLPKGAVQAINELALIEDQKPISVQLSPLAYWPDGSIRWIHANFLVGLGASCLKKLVLTKKHNSAPFSPVPAFSQTIDNLIIRTSTGCVTLDTDSLSWQVRTKNITNIPSRITLKDELGLPCISKAETNWKIIREGSVFVAVTMDGDWLKSNNEPLAKFTCVLRVFLETGLIQVELTTHNPKRAYHPGGLWDLGDSGSVYFRELAIETMLPVNNIARVAPQATDKSAKTFHLSDFNLYQDSSGGKRWHSRNHLDCKGEISTQFCGFRLSTQNDFLHEGKRANPLICIQYDFGKLDVAVPDFWQNFPTSLRKEKNNLIVGLFPKDSKNVYELQGGEQKTMRFLTAYDSHNSIAATVYKPLIPLLTPESYEKAGAFPWFKACTKSSALDELIANGLKGSSNFFAKREAIDEFGWRNFGDIFADHESLYQPEDETPFISHYNNQYDPLYGFARQFALTGDRRWFQLMDDLARHVTDIDIYHTKEDRAEYNNGLFWHTDHYLDAKTSTHRTFSQLNNSSSTPGQTGGGPAEEHCYSTGLLYHYQLTGNEQSRRAVLELARWMTALYEGQGGFLEQLFALKKREIPILKKMIRGESVTTHIYPFKRGTGNYLNTLLDAWIIDENRLWLINAESVIGKTIHPADVIEHRNLLDIEARWSYLILLASLFRYLQLKRQLDCEDEQYNFTKTSLLRYTHWMLKNERSFLFDKTQLEFPNDTWVAQDIRKAMLMFQASELDYENSAQYRRQGQKWLDEVTTALQNSQERQLTRVIVILMQNYGPQSLTTSPPLIDEHVTFISRQWTPPIMTWKLLISRIGRRTIRAILTFRPLREITWLTRRLDRS